MSFLFSDIGYKELFCERKKSYKSFNSKRAQNSFNLWKSNFFWYWAIPYKTKEYFIFLVKNVESSLFPIHVDSDVKKSIIVNQNTMCRILFIYYYRIFWIFFKIRYDFHNFNHCMLFWVMYCWIPMFVLYLNVTLFVIPMSQ